ncbi:hypothetical protein CK203_065164 [Vitis vinifera]|uniref:Reverse transcriptase Ty1/copia-type domain-containing protein n=1 Tax=Vitis vinifera TaxID=29760 RepID=A0A438G704_VITVI|nr:hypothetical protein CK203_065164 [Vitis vinifera]
MHNEFEMSMMGELNFFLGLQIKQLKEGTFTNQAKYIRDLLKRFNMEEAKIMKTPMSSSIKIDKDEKGKYIDSTMYRGMIDVDFVGCKVERKITCGTCHFLGHSLVSWHRVENCLDSKRIYHIFDIAPVGLRVYKSKMWSIVPNFEPREAIQRIYGLPDAHRMGKPSTHSLTSSVEIHSDWEMNPFGIFDDDAHDYMLREHESYTPLWPLPYQSEKIIEKTNIRLGDRDSHILERDSFIDRGVHFETTFSELSYTEPSFSGHAFTEPTHTEIPPSQASPAPDHAPWMDLST